MTEIDVQTHFFADCVLDDESNNAFSPDHRDANSEMVHLPTPDRETNNAWDGLARVEFGGEDARPLFVECDSDAKDGEEDDDDDETNAALDSRPSTRRNSSVKSVSLRTNKSASTDLTAPDQDHPPEQQQQRKTTTRRTKRGPDAELMEDEAKRTKFLERNRIAASKCREKKKQYVAGLEDHKMALEAQHAHLQLEYDGLVDEVSQLKHHLMAHAKCNDPNIDRWLSNEARRFVQTSHDLFGHAAFAAFSAPAVPHRNNAGSSTTTTAYPHVLDMLSGPERRGSMTFSHGQYPGRVAGEIELVGSPQCTASSLQTSPTDAAFPALASPHLVKREPDINYDHMPDSLFASEPGYAGG